VIVIDIEMDIVIEICIDIQIVVLCYLCKLVYIKFKGGLCFYIRQ
jgi:hypothetical protein